MCVDCILFGWKDDPGFISTTRPFEVVCGFRLSVAGRLRVCSRLVVANRTSRLTLPSRWEYFQSLHVEYSIIRGQLPFRLSLVSSHSLVYSVKMTVGEGPLHS